MKNTRKLTCLLLALLAVMALALSSCGTPASETPTTEATTAAQELPAVTLRLATTTSVDDSGLLAYLAPSLKAEENITLDILAQGSGQAIKTATDGNADVLIAHSPAAEQEFVESGFGVDRAQFMYNYFVVAGPAADPAAISGAESASAAFELIFNANKENPAVIFYSRDDQSGTDTKEKGLWNSAGHDPAELSAAFYKKTGKGMLDTLIMADNTDGYTLTDKSTLLANAAKLPNLKALYEKSDDLKNVYSVTLINSEKYADLQHEGAQRFHDWLLKDGTQQLIAAYGVEQYGQALFFVGE